ncbi:MULTISPECIES: hypothetical protein [Xanthomonas translucens group]|nr:hypothetical protein [Xanthomonas translucens]UKE61764.1 hypothetical protein KM539_19035 [Xanthomonas translucens pv. poae]
MAEPVAAAIIKRGQADASLLAQVTIAKLQFWGNSRVRGRFRRGRC